MRYKLAKKLFHFDSNLEDRHTLILLSGVRLKIDIHDIKAGTEVYKIEIDTEKSVLRIQMSKDKNDIRQFKLGLVVL